MCAKQRKREGNLFLFVWKRYAPVNGSAAIRMFARNERSTLFSACITICSIRSRQSLKLFDARVIDAPPPPSPPPPAPPSRHRRRHRRCRHRALSTTPRPLIHPLFSPSCAAIGCSSVQQPPSIRPHLSDWRPHYEYCILWLRMSNHAGAFTPDGERSDLPIARYIKKISLNQCVCPEQLLITFLDCNSQYRGE